jgi:hypothetical protein
MARKFAACFSQRVARRPEVLDAIEEPFDAFARPIEHRAEAGFPAAVHHPRDVGRGTGGLDLPT